MRIWIQLVRIYYYHKNVIEIIGGLNELKFIWTNAAVYYNIKLLNLINAAGENS